MSKIPTIKRQKITEGAIVKVPLIQGFHTYARLLKIRIAFYDCRTKEDIEDLQVIVSSPILFITAVYDYAITKGYWLKVGTLPIEERLQVLPPQYVQDALQPHKYEIFYQDGTRKPATAEECKGLERVAVWTPERIQERINDYYLGQKNYSVERMSDPEIPHYEIKKIVNDSKKPVSYKKQTAMVG